MTPPPTHDSNLSLGERRADALARTSEHVLRAWREFDHAREIETVPSAELRALLEEPLPEEAHDVIAMIDHAAAVLDASLAQSRPRYFGFIGSSGLEVGAIADLLAHSYDTNLAVDARAATDLEDQSRRWLADFLGFPATGGSFTSGGTISNLTALAAAREAALPDSRRRGLGDARPTLYCSREAHYSIVRAAELLGIGREQVRAVAIDDERRLVPEDLDRQLAADRAAGRTPVAVVATAGTTLTGAVDPLDAIADVGERHGVWLHVDGAYGLPAATVPGVAERFRGLERADSVTVDCHKWMYVPKACSAVLVRDGDRLARTFAHDEAYMPHDGEHRNAVDTTVEYSRPLRALKLWMAFATHGARAMRGAVARNCDQAQLLYDLAAAHPELEVLPHRPSLSIVPFRWVGGCADPDAHNDALCAALQRDGRVFVSPATIDGRVYLRPCVTNFRTSDDDIRALVDVVLALGGNCAALHG